MARVYADRSDEPEAAPTTLLEVYRERIDHIFGPSFLEQQQLHKVLVQFEGLVQHAKSLSQLGETEFALSILHALIHQSIAPLSRYTPETGITQIRQEVHSRLHPSCHRHTKIAFKRFRA